MIKLGITGGIGSGKSVVSSLLEVLGIPVYIADNESKRLINASPIIKEKLINLFGKDIYIQNGVNKKLLASYIFTDSHLLEQVNAIIHPEVYIDFLKWSSLQTSNMCAIETAILFESGFDKGIDIAIMIYAPLAVRIDRVVLRDNLSREETLDRIKNQLSDEIKKSRSDYIIYNDGKRALIPQVENIIFSKI